MTWRSVLWDPGLCCITSLKNRKMGLLSRPLVWISTGQTQDQMAVSADSQMSTQVLSTFCSLCKSLLLWVGCQFLADSSFLFDISRRRYLLQRSELLLSQTRGSVHFSSNWSSKASVSNICNTYGGQGLAGTEQAKASPGARIQFTFIS